MSRRRFHSHTEVREECRDEVLVRQARRHRRRGEHRRAMVLLREACQLVGDDARLWTLYGVSCVKLRRVSEGKRALSQALWLRNRAHDAPRAAVTQRMLEALESGCEALPLRAA
jgi:Flp pilus assembly protein TadD